MYCHDRTPKWSHSSSWRGRRLSITAVSLSLVLFLNVHQDKHTVSRQEFRTGQDNPIRVHAQPQGSNPKNCIQPQLKGLDRI